jgi:L-ascorbate metabolism protein UlaG (beta-lactamase superfamily)
MSNGSITWLGHSTTLITTARDHKIVIDPWLEGNPSCREEWQSPGAHSIVLTHGHSDHASSAAPLARKTGATVFATFELAALLAKVEGIPTEQIEFMNKGGTVKCGKTGARIHLTNAFHSSSFDASDGVTYYAGEACGTVITLDDGTSIYHAGDTCLFSDMAQIGEKYNIDTALLPIGDRFTMCPGDAAAAVALIKPRRVIPIHYGTFDLLTGTTTEFAKALEQTDHEAELCVLEPGGWINL